MTRDEHIAAGDKLLTGFEVERDGKTINVYQPSERDLLRAAVHYLAAIAKSGGRAFVPHKPREH